MWRGSEEGQRTEVMIIRKVMGDEGIGEEYESREAGVAMEQWG